VPPSLLALATLVGATQIRSFLFYGMPTKVAKASKEGAISLRYRAKLRQRKYGFSGTLGWRK